MSETAEEQRARILNGCDTNPGDYDLALLLGYEPETWDGMWRLIAKPFTFVNGYVIAREVAHPTRVKFDSRGDVRLRVRCVKVPA